MKSKQKIRTKDYKSMVSSYYATITEPYRQFWGDYFHPAIFENPEDDLDTALLKTHKLFMQDSKLNPDKIAIDLGCGIGSLSKYIAYDVGCKVIGINISDYQLKIARKMVKNNGKNINFMRLDIMDVDLIEKNFDAAFLIDVGCHLPDKEKALKKIYKVLNKGGRIVIADWIQKERLNSFEKELLIEPFNNYWNFPYMESMKGYKKIFKKIGYKTIKAEDVSEKTKKNWDMFYDVALNEINDMNTEKLLSYIKNPQILKQGPKALKIAKNQFYANVFAKISFEAGVFKYGYFVGEK